MNRLIRLILILPIGVGCAALAALVVGAVGAVASGWGGRLADVLAATGLSIAAAALSGVDPATLASFTMLLGAVAIGVVLVPIAIVALIGEALGVTSWIAYAFGTGAAFALVPILFPGDPATYGWPADATLGFLATGIAAGSVYWLVAGRGAAGAAPSRRIDDA